MRIVPIGDSERRLEVTLEMVGGAATATLSLTLPNGRRATRVLRAATCDEAVDAAALVAAVTLDPTALTARRVHPHGHGRIRDRWRLATVERTVYRRRPRAHRTDTGGSAGPPAESPVPRFREVVFVPAELVAGPAPSTLYGFGLGLMGVWERGSVFSRRRDSRSSTSSIRNTRRPAALRISA